SALHRGDRPVPDRGAGVGGSRARASGPLLGDGSRPAEPRMILFEADGLTKHFPLRKGLFGGGNGAVRAVDGGAFTIEAGRTLGVVGESGCGKSTTAKLVLKPEEPTAGSIRFMGKKLADLDAAGLREYRKSVQAVFQDPFASLNPRMRVSAIVAEPLITN